MILNASLVKQLSVEYEQLRRTHARVDYQAWIRGRLQEVGRNSLSSSEALVGRGVKRYVPSSQQTTDVLQRTQEEPMTRRLHTSATVGGSSATEVEDCSHQQPSLTQPYEAKGTGGMHVKDLQSARKPEWVSSAMLQDALRASPVVPAMHAAASRERKLAVASAVARHELCLGMAPMHDSSNEPSVSDSQGAAVDVVQVAQQLARQNQRLEKALQAQTFQLVQQQELLHAILNKEKADNLAGGKSLSAGPDGQPGFDPATQQQIQVLQQGSNTLTSAVDHLPPEARNSWLLRGQPLSSSTLDNPPPSGPAASARSSHGAKAQINVKAAVEKLMDSFNSHNGSRANYLLALLQDLARQKAMRDMHRSRDAGAKAGNSEHPAQHRSSSLSPVSGTPTGQQSALGAKTEVLASDAYPSGGSLGGNGTLRRAASQPIPAFTEPVQRPARQPRARRRWDSTTAMGALHAAVAPSGADMAMPVLTNDHGFGRVSHAQSRVGGVTYSAATVAELEERIRVQLAAAGLPHRGAAGDTSAATDQAGTAGGGPAQDGARHRRDATPPGDRPRPTAGAAALTAVAAAPATWRQQSEQTVPAPPLTASGAAASQPECSADSRGITPEPCGIAPPAPTTLARDASWALSLPAAVSGGGGASLAEQLQGLGEAELERLALRRILSALERVEQREQQVAWRGAGQRALVCSPIVDPAK